MSWPTGGLQSLSFISYSFLHASVRPTSPGFGNEASKLSLGLEEDRDMTSPFATGVLLWILHLGGVVTLKRELSHALHRLSFVATLPAISLVFVVIIFIL